MQDLLTTTVLEAVNPRICWLLKLRNACVILELCKVCIYEVGVCATIY